MSHGRVIIVLNFNKFQPVTADDAELNWIRLYRKICDCPWYHDQNMVHLYIHFMIKVKVEQQPNGLFLAQCKCTLRKLSVETGIPITILRNSIKKLQKEGEIIFETNSTGLSLQNVRTSLAKLQFSKDIEIKKNVPWQGDYSFEFQQVSACHC